jgi:hypothetical protein
VRDRHPLTTPAPVSRRPRVPAEVISPSVWLDLRFCLRYRASEDMKAVRGVVGTSATIRPWGQQCGQRLVTDLRRRRPRREINGTATESFCSSMARGPVYGERWIKRQVW